MKCTWIAAPAAVALAGAALAQHAQVSCVAVNPSSPAEVWVCNRDNGSVSVIDVAAGVATHEIAVGVRPRSLAFSRDGARVFVANQRGNVPLTVNTSTGFTGSEVRGTLSVIDAASRQVTATLTDVGVEPYGVAVAPNGRWFAVTAFRSGSIGLFSTASLVRLAQYEYLADTSVIPAPFTIADVDSDRDGLADLGEPRGFAIRADSARIYVAHGRSPFVSALDVALDASGDPTGVSLAARIGLDTYPFDPFYNPVKVQTVASQGVPRFGEDVALSPDGTRALVPHLLHNVNHDVGFAFPAWLPGAFANRVYPALSVIDASANSFARPGDRSRRLHNELLDPLAPGEFAAFGAPTPNGGGLATLGGHGTPLVGNAVAFVLAGLAPGQSALLCIGPEVDVPMGALGTQRVNPRYTYPVPPSGTLAIPVAARAKLIGAVTNAQALVFDANGQPKAFTNGLRFRLSDTGTGQNKLGHRAGHPSRVVYDPSGHHALMLNRGSEDLFLYEVNGSNLRLAATFPPRLGFTERPALDTSTPLGDLPLGLALAPDAATSNDDALVYVMNELTRTLSVLRVDWATNAITQVRAQIPTLIAPDDLTLSQRMGDELLEDASRAQTTGAAGTLGEFNNSCASCHFEGGEDGDVWQRADGPRSTLPLHGGSLATGLMLWRGVRLNLGECGPMFGGENGGQGLLGNAEQQALIDAHELMPVPLNPNLLPNGQLTPLAAFGRDLYFGRNDTGLNPALRRAGCADCHPQADANTGAARGFTTDFLDPLLTQGENLQAVDPGCLSLTANVVSLNVRNVNSGVNVDVDGDGSADLDRNGDGYVDLETYAPMNADRDGTFQRDDPNSYPCPQQPSNPTGLLKTFARDLRRFSVPTKLGVFASGPYFHDHSAVSLRSVVDPQAQALSPVYGSAAWSGSPPYPGLDKLFNEFHDVRGHEQFVPGASKVQLGLVSGAAVDADIEALLAWIRSI